MEDFDDLDEPRRSGSKKGLIIAFIIFMLAINAILIFLNFNKNKEISLKDEEITEQQAKIDTISTQLDDALRELQAKKEELASLGADTSRLGEQLRLITLERDKLKRQGGNGGNYNRLKRELDNAHALVGQYETEVSKLRAQVDTLFKYNTVLNTKYALMADSIKTFNSSKEELLNKLALASVLRAEHITTYVLSSKGKEKEGGEYKSKDIDLLRVSFLLAENKIAKMEGKEIILRVIEPDGGALFDLSTGGGSFMYNGKEIFYTAKQEILFDNKEQQVTFDYRKGSIYKAGNHVVEVYSEGHKIGESKFVVK